MNDVHNIPNLFWGFSCGSAGEESACNVEDLGLIPGLGRSPGEGKGYPLQYSGLENSVDCIVHVSGSVGRCAGRCRASQLASIRQMSRQVSRGSAGEYQSDEHAGVASLINSSQQPYEVGNIIISVL